MAFKKRKNVVIQVPHTFWNACFWSPSRLYVLRRESTPVNMAVANQCQSFIESLSWRYSAWRGLCMNLVKAGRPSETILLIFCKLMFLVVIFRKARAMNLENACCVKHIFETTLKKTNLWSSPSKYFFLPVLTQANISSLSGYSKSNE